MSTPLDSFKEVKPHTPHEGLEVAPRPAPISSSFYEGPKYGPTVRESSPVDIPATQSANTSEGPRSAPPVQERTIMGARRPTFFLCVALAIVVLAAAIGGGVGGSMAVRNAKSSCNALNPKGSANDAPGTITSPNPTEIPTATPASTGTATPITTTTTATATTGGGGILVVPTGTVKLDCPQLSDDMSISFSGDTWVFTPACGIDYNGGDFGALIAYSFHDCLHACAAHNHFSGNESCTTVTFRANQTEWVPESFGNCWLKAGEPGPVKVSGLEGDQTVGARLKGKV
ncbi:hypothetical protein GGR50DRAFT_646355 [Xylaria sp. CBS 124048]|nr:hypothetical protein GGR50DRAFT_646355 [Xylaria sp. CBS 124048]